MCFNFLNFLAKFAFDATILNKHFHIIIAFALFLKAIFLNHFIHFHSILNLSSYFFHFILIINFYFSNLLIIVNFSFIINLIAILIFLFQFKSFLSCLQESITFLLVLINYFIQLLFYF